MIARILPKASRNFAGVKYNTSKIDRNTGELMLTANFGAIQALTGPRPQDLVNYLLALSASNTVIKNTQFHAVISGRGQRYDKHELTRAAVLWLNEMKYGDQPYLIVFHKDTDNNHVHVVSSRVDKDGKQIDRDYEHVRAVKNIDKVLGYTFAMQYRFSTRAQFYLVLENRGYLGRDYLNDKKLQQKIDSYSPDQVRIAELKAAFLEHKSSPDLVSRIHKQLNVDLVFHGEKGKRPYGYTVIDHGTKQVFKGSEILKLKLLLDGPAGDTLFRRSESYLSDAKFHADATGHGLNSGDEFVAAPIYIRPVIISDDVDDQQVLGMKRRRQKKARTNTR